MTDAGDMGARGGDDSVLSSSIYAELKAIARAQMAGERRGHTLQATALVNEAWLRVRERLPDAEGRSRFLALAARAMHRVLIDHARARGRLKRGGDRGERVPLSAVELAEEGTPEEILAVEEAIQRLEGLDPKLAAVARLRVFADLDETETAAALGTSTRTVRRDWALARAWLQRELSP